jgi:hypothetical protein
VQCGWLFPLGGISCFPQVLSLPVPAALHSNKGSHS